MTDIVERLRHGVYGTDRIPLCAEAADEIERLRLDAARYRKWREVYTGQGPYDLLSALADAWEPGQVDAAIDAAMKG